MNNTHELLTLFPYTLTHEQCEYYLGPEMSFWNTISYEWTYVYLL